MCFRRMLLGCIKLILACSFFLPMTALAHVLSITPTSLFPASMFVGSTATASYKVTNIGSNILLTMIEERQFPASSGMSVLFSTCGALLSPGQSCDITLQVIVPPRVEGISTSLRVRASPSADGVEFPIFINVTQTPAFIITPVAGANGTISPNTPQGENIGASQTFTATPNLGFRVSQWLVDGVVAQTLGNSFTLTNIQASHTVQVNFELIPFVITPLAGPGGTITPSAPQVVLYGRSITFTATPSATPAPGFVVDQWFLDGNVVAGQSGLTTYTLSNVIEPHAVQVTFKRVFTVTATAGTGGTVTPGSAQVSNPGSLTFTANVTNPATTEVNTWTSTCAGAASQPGGLTYTVTNPTANCTVNVSFITFVTVTSSVAPSGSGTVTPGSALVTNPGSQQFTASPASGYVLGGFTATPVSCGTGSTSTTGNIFTVTNPSVNCSVVATFTPQFIVDYSVLGSGGTVTAEYPPGTQFNSGSPVTSGGNVVFTATADTNFVINQWLVDGQVQQSATGASTFTLNVTANHTTPGVQVTFLQQYSYTASVGTGSGSISPSGTHTVSSGTAIPFIATPGSNSQVDTWTLNGGLVQTGGTNYSLTVTSAPNAVVVNFIPQWVVTPDPAQVPGGHISVPAAAVHVDTGADVPFTAVPDSGYVVAQWLVNSQVQPNSANNNFTLLNVQGNDTVSVTFTPVVTFTITATAGAGGTISPSGSVPVNSGASQTFTATPTGSNTVGTWTSTCSTPPPPGTATYTANNITANCAVNVTFVTGYTVTAVPGAHGSIQAPASQTVPSGSSVTFTAVPDATYKVFQWTINGVLQQTGGTSFTLNNVTATQTINVSFVLDNFVVTATVTGGNGTVGTSPATVLRGGSVTFTAAPAAGYSVNQWTKNGTIVQTGGITYTDTNVTFADAITVSFTVATLIVVGTDLTDNLPLIVSGTATPSTINWATITIPSVPAGSLQSGSCIGTVCAAVGSNTTTGFPLLLLSTNSGAAWSVVTTVTPAIVTAGNFNSVSCTGIVPNVICVAAGGSSANNTSTLVVGTGLGGTATWSNTTIPSLGSGYLTGVSCTGSAPAAFCAVVGSNAAQTDYLLAVSNNVGVLPGANTWTPVTTIAHSGYFSSIGCNGIAPSAVCAIAGTNSSITPMILLPQ